MPSGRDGPAGARLGEAIRGDERRVFLLWPSMKNAAAARRKIIAAALNNDPLAGLDPDLSP
jgi:hypothetical protein